VPPSYHNLLARPHRDAVRDQHFLPPSNAARRPAGARRTRNLRKNAYLRSMLKAFDFCIPTRGTKVPDRADWLHEIKYDGYRCASNAMATVYD
jgi:ATP-dependent DNA ligase